MAADLAKHPIVAVDTESNSLFVYREQVCLIQFSTPSTDYLVDPMALIDLAPLGPLFADPHIEKVFHAAEYDLICLKRDFGFQFANLFDTMQAARILGRPSVGLGAMLESEFGVTVDKRYQRANWGQRPLPPAQLRYARLDTHYLIPLRLRLLEALRKSGRWPLAEEDFRRTCHVNGRTVDDTLEPCYRIPGSQDLSHQQNSVLQQLCRFRDRLARQSNSPPFRILSNQGLLELARVCPQTLDELDRVRDVNSRIVERYGQEMLAAIQQGLLQPPAPRASSPRPSDAYLLRLDALRTWRKQSAQDLGVESDVVLPRDVLYAIAEANPRRPEDLQPLMAQLPYRMEHFGPSILQTLQRR
jgi:ribonuclease D